MRTPNHKKAARSGAASTTNFKVNHNAPRHISQYFAEALEQLVENVSVTDKEKQGSKP